MKKKGKRRRRIIRRRNNDDDDDNDDYDDYDDAAASFLPQQDLDATSSAWSQQILVFLPITVNAVAENRLRREKWCVRSCLLADVAAHWATRVGDGWSIFLFSTWLSEY